MIIQKSVIDLHSKDSVKDFVIGDIHGCYQELLDLENKIKKRVMRSKNTECRFISVGDLFDRGPDAKNVMEHFTNGNATGTHHVILGNHETFLILAFWGQRRDLLDRASIKPAWYHKLLFRLFYAQTLNVHAWRQNGGRVVFESYKADIDDPGTWDKFPENHLKLVFNAPLAIRTSKAVISHALMDLGDLEILESVDQGIPVDERLLESAVVRSLWERKQPSDRISPTKRHISGHTPLSMVQRLQRLGTIQIDTGAVYGGSLTAIDLQTFRTTRVKSGFSCRR